jgi:4-amino-4-deoxy-L-arabinose transferase-like glycosyltransferase
MAADINKYMNRRKTIFLLFLCYGFIAVVRLTAPFDIDDRDQAQQGLYVLDVVQRGAFILPFERGNPSTKPPFYNWVAAVLSIVLGGVTDFTIKLPAVLSGLGVVFVTYLLAEILFSMEVGLFAGLILILSYHFADLSFIARTDMMQCFFISLSLYLFLLSYRQRKEKSIYNLMMFVGMGLGSITKSPVAFLFPGLIILIFLFCIGDLKWLKSMQIGLGMIIWLVILLGWFLSALMIGGRSYFDIVVMNEMINRFLGIGNREKMARPFYFLVGHFFGKSLPWSLFVPSALVHSWKPKGESGAKGLLFLIIWFLTGIIFFSISRGKRADYLLPLYPAASVLVGHFWFSLTNREEPGRWKTHLRVLSFVYLFMTFCLIVSLALLLARPDLAKLIARIFPKSSETLELLNQSIHTSSGLFLFIGLPLLAVSISGAALALKGSLKNLFMILLVASALNLSLNKGILSPDLGLSGKQKKLFCSRVAAKLDSMENLKFRSVQSSILFYMGKNERPLNRFEVLEFFRKTHNPHLITTQPVYLELREQANFEIVLLEESEYLIREKTSYVLIGKGKSQPLDDEEGALKE